MNCIVSSTPGRIRARHASLHAGLARSALCIALEKMEGVTRTTANPKAGSIVVYYDPRRNTAATLEAAIAGHCHAAEATAPDPGNAASATPTRPPAAQLHAPSTRVRVNRLAKRGMLLGLGASLVLAALGNKRWHAATGLVFVGCLAAHLTVHRRHLLR
ncbi:MAG: hypothetical protein A3F78_07545 [Burkholderiales bacterium RIFCSPLOWO2_12_FULL_61_40]|nr:MAG: hypothetical protein A3F78_07545 [Burkholderiales bacterium RIFCSPLOWO2_12_FULL_61_40]